MRRACTAPVLPYPLAMRPIAALLAAAVLTAADHGEVLAVLGADRLAVQYYQLPIVVRLAELDIPAETVEAAQARLGKATGLKANLTWAPDLGADDGGVPRVYVSLGTESKSLNEALVESGLARFAPSGQGGRVRDRLAAAEAAARRARVGLWATAEAPAKPSPPPGVAAKPAAAGPFCAEVDGRLFYPSDAPEAATLNPKRLVYYANEAAARKAGKQPWQAAAPGSAGTTIADARAAVSRGRALLTQAVDMPATAERDDRYQRAFLELTAGMQVLNRLAEAAPDDEKLAEELRACMQMRYTAMKSRRLQ